MPDAQSNPAEKPLPPGGMHDRYGPILKLLFHRFFDPIQFPEEAIARIRTLAGEGTVVYMSRSASLLHFLYLNHVCLKAALPLARFVHGVDTVLVQPVEALFNQVRILGSEETGLEDEDAQPGEQLKSALRRNEAALLYLERPVTITNPRQAVDEVSAVGEDELWLALLDAQATSDRPIFIVPHVIVWDRHPERESRDLTDAIFGVPEAPGLLRSFAGLLTSYRKAVVKVAEPVNLREFVSSHPEENAAQRARDLHAACEQRLSLEVYEVTGPRIKPHMEFKQMVLADPRIHQAVAELAAGDETKIEALRKKAHDLLDEIAAEPSIRWPLALNWTLNIFWKRMYEGFVVDEEGFQRIRNSLRKAPMVFCPSHKSHVDYLVISQLCLKYALPLPHIAAGINLSFWPMGPIFRHSGAFFLRRSFKGNPLYPVVFRTYLRHVMKERIPIEFFLEGTRSRTGKLLSPRFGILSWLIHAYLEGTGEDIQFAPISIDYEKIVESSSYVQELSGGEKQKEDVIGLLESRKVLKARYGKIYLQVGELISLKQFIEDAKLPAGVLTADEQRTLVQDIAYHILFAINQISTVTPSALLAFALLTHRRRGMSQAILIERATWAADWIRGQGHTRFSEMLRNFRRSIAEAALRFSRDGLVLLRDTGTELVYAPVERRRLDLDYYRNNIIHHFVPASICALALESFSVGATPVNALRDRIRALSRWLKHEFLFRSERHFDEEVRNALEALKREGVVKEESGFLIKVGDHGEKRALFCAVIEHFVECYWLTAMSLELLRKGPLFEKDFIARTLTAGDRLYACGELQFFEAMNRETVKNALRIFTEREVIDSEPQEGRKGPRLQLRSPWADKGKLEEIQAELRRYLTSRK